MNVIIHSLFIIVLLCHFNNEISVILSRYYAYILMTAKRSFANLMLRSLNNQYSSFRILPPYNPGFHFGMIQNETKNLGEIILPPALVFLKALRITAAMD